ncbi:MAG: Ribosomal silencing factor RsfS [uncultured Thiotrichaceae bacterium]|uniref:Ribosomal silencing factor RsfS n=1 Tax=uncultured Thiotrichaceae bacterium TaxID=298394 RepID=A0A6S6SAR4_9GAMM|nr:MAG: Ribosomal silencing factor RsfS [uncultured Thiotrichaceae bacterium]
MEKVSLLKMVQESLDDMKAQDVRILDVSDKSTITETIIIATGTSSRHVKAVANRVVMDAKHNGHPPLGIEGEQGSDWVLVDLDEIVLHVMIQQTRDFYNLEKLWSTQPVDESTSKA